MKKIFLFAFFALSFSGSAALADELVWTPINPSFGGNSFNAAWLMQQAEAQNKLKDETQRYDPFRRDALQDFSESLNRQILSRLSSRLIQTMFGEAAFEPGNYEIGDYIINISSTETGIRIEITDQRTGSETSMEIPFY